MHSRDDNTTHHANDAGERFKTLFDTRIETTSLEADDVTKNGVTLATWDVEGEWIGYVAYNKGIYALDPRKSEGHEVYYIGGLSEVAKKIIEDKKEEEGKNLKLLKDRSFFVKLIKAEEPSIHVSTESTEEDTGEQESDTSEESVEEEESSPAQAPDCGIYNEIDRSPLISDIK